MSRKTRKLKARIEELRNDVKYHLSNVRILLNNPSLLQVEELKFQYSFFPVRETISGSVRKIERIKDEVKNDNVVAEGVSFGTFSGEEYKFPKEELISTEYHVSKHAPVNMLDNKNAISLPEHWYIQVTKDNKVILTDYLKNHKQRYEQFSEHWYVSFQRGPASFFHSDSKEAGHSMLQPRNGYTEVTTEMVENYMKTWHNINKFVDKDWIQIKKESAKNVGEQLAAQNDVNKDGSLPPFAITPENLTPISKHVMDITEEDKKQKTIKDFFSILKGDPVYLRSWKDNIAMAFQDNYKWAQDSGEINIHKIANDSANYFFGTLFRQPSDVIEVAEKLYYFMNPGTKMDVPSSAFEIAEKWHNEWQNGWKESDPEEFFFDWCIKNKMPKKEGATGYNPVYSPEHLEAKNKLFASNNVNKDGEVTIKIIDDYTESEKLTKEQIEKYDDFFKSHVGHAIEAGTHNAPDEYVLVKVKVGSLIVDPDFKGSVVGGGFGTKENVSIGDLKKRADAMEKCEDQECKPIKQEYEKTLENVVKIDRFIGLKYSSSNSRGNKDVVFKKNVELNTFGRKVFYYNVGNQALKYTPDQILNDWKNNNIKPFD